MAAGLVGGAAYFGSLEIDASKPIIVRFHVVDSCILLIDIVLRVLTPSSFLEAQH